MDAQLLANAVQLSHLPDQTTIVVVGYQVHGTRDYLITQKSEEEGEQTIYLVDCKLPENHELFELGWFNIFFSKSSKKIVEKAYKIISLQKRAANTQ